MDKWLSTYLGVVILTGLRYGVFAGSAYLLGYVWFKRRWFHRKIVAAFPASADTRRELFHSLKTLLVFGLTATATHLAIKQGYGQMYFTLDRYGWGWYPYRPRISPCRSRCCR